MPIYTGFYGGFMPKHEWKEDRTGIISHTGEEHGELWIQLFLDLVYVAMFINLSSYIEKCGNCAEVLEMAFGIFLMLFTCRLSIDEYSNRFFSDDIFHRLAYFMYTFGVMIMVANINDEPSGDAAHRALFDFENRALSDGKDIGNCQFLHDYWTGFLYGFMFTRCALIALYGMLCIQNVESQRQFFPTVVGYTVTTIIAAIALNSAGPALQDATAYYDIVALEAAFHILPKFLEFLHSSGYQQVPQIIETFPIDIYEYQNRLGVLFMMVLGESIIQLTTFNYDSTKTRKSFRYISVSFIFVFSIGMQYFDAIHRSKGKPHAMKRSILSNVAYVWLHPFLVFAMLLATVGLVMGYHAIMEGEQNEPYFNHLLAIGAFWVLILFACMRASHKGLIKCLSKPSTALHFVIRICFAFTHLGMWWYEGDPVVVMSAHAVISIVVNVIDVYVALRLKNKEIIEAETAGAWIEEGPPSFSSACNSEAGGGGGAPNGFVERPTFRSSIGTGASEPSKVFAGRRIWRSSTQRTLSSATTFSQDTAVSPFRSHDDVGLSLSLR